MFDDIKLLPLSRPQVPFIDADIDLMDIRRLVDWCEKTAKEYARAAVLAERETQQQDKLDAARYRWLRKNWQFSLHGQPVWVDIDPDLKPTIDRTTKLDAAIDAAMRKEGEQ